MSGSTPKVLGTAIASGGAVVGVDILADTGAETTVLGIAVGLVILLTVWAIHRKAQIN